MLRRSILVLVGLTGVVALLIGNALATKSSGGFGCDGPR